MDDRWAPVLLIGIPAIFVLAYLLAWRSKKPTLRATATIVLSTIVGLAIFWIGIQAIYVGTYYVHFRNGPLWQWIAFEVVAIAIIVCLAVVVTRSFKKLIAADRS
ncbi:hypothetical protein Acid345_3228 [Candidatus Koribacter versatilis Ellin345]|uniref:Uncharacterized protein n=1 Tax=Koribacter versatilis (strain Ellin345) TaxID=204669 RepID=Q1ILM1_KORVE|nr:hypothetical protein [Candidatus Koribacter versatilis]ABF42229.1 hypothetical protein Acid345_3228 [Candidatus Koribacter versatilis Ellin345]